MNPSASTCPAGDPSFGETTFANDANVLGARPSVSRDVFRSALAIALRDITRGAQALVSDSVELSIEGPVTTRVPSPRVFDAGATREARMWTVRTRGQIASVGDVDLRLEDVSRAVARALFQATSWSEIDPEYRDKIPRDGGQFLATLQSNIACSGGLRLNTAVVMAGGCTRLLATPRPTTPAAATGFAPCSTRVRSPFWLRPLVTFDHVGPRYPEGTVINVLAEMRAVRGTLGIYNVAVGNLRGFAALSAADLEGCPNVPKPPAAARPNENVPCGTFTTRRAVEFYEHVGGTDVADLTQRSLSRGVQMRVYADFGQIPRTGGMHFYAVQIRSGTYVGRTGIAAFLPGEVGCIPRDLPTSNPSGDVPSSSSTAPAGNLAPIGGLPRPIDPDATTIALWPIAAELRQTISGRFGVTNVGSGITEKGATLIVYTEGDPTYAANGLPHTWRNIPVEFRQKNRTSR